MEPQTYTTGEHGLHALVREGREPAIVLLHGAAGNALAWLPLLPALGARRVIALDLPGHGESRPVEDWSLERLAIGVGEAVGANHPGALIWGGHSWGGKVAAILAALHPERVQGLLLVDPSPASPIPIGAEEFVDMALAGELGPWESMDAAVEAVRALPQYRKWSDEIARAFRRGLAPTPDGRVAARTRREWLVAIAAAALLHDDSATIARVDRPTLLAVADQSLYWQEPTNIAALPQAERVVIPSHHWILWDNPTALTAAVEPWLAKFDGGLS